MKKLLVFVVVLAAIAGVALVTCPDKAAHKNAMMSVINEKLNEEVNPSGSDALGFIGATLGSKLVEMALDSNVQFDNHFIYSTGTLNLKDGPKTVSLGIFGHVFTFSKEQLDEALAQLTQQQ